MTALVKKYKGKVEFLFIYCREAHPDDEEKGNGPPRDRKPIRQAKTLDDRRATAQMFCDDMKLARRILVDEFGEQSVQRVYGGENPTIVVAAYGRIALKMHWTKGDLLDGFLQKFLAAGGKVNLALATSVPFRGPGDDPPTPEMIAESADRMLQGLRLTDREMRAVKSAVRGKIKARLKLQQNAHALGELGWGGDVSNEEINQAIRAYESAVAAYQKSSAEFDRQMTAAVSPRARVQLLARGILDNGLGFMPPMGPRR